MGRPPKKQNRKEPRITLSPETKRGITAVIILMFSVILLLSLVGLAGPVGQLLDRGLQWAGGWGRWLIPLFLGYIGVNLLLPQPWPGSITIGLLLTILSLLALFQILPNEITTPAQVKMGLGGGYLGLALALPIYHLLGKWAGLVIIFSLIIIGLLITFNTTLKQLLMPALMVTKLRLPGWPTDKTNSDELEASETDETIIETAPFTADEQKAAEEIIVTNAPLVKLRPKIKVDLPLDLLTHSTEQPTSGDIKDNQERIKNSLKTFGIEVEMGEVNVGPTVTQFTLKPAEGVKLSQIVTLQNDLALALAAHPLRLEAPIPGKSLVGIEVPNQSIAVVKLRDILESPSFKNRRSLLMVALGKDVAGQPLLANLNAMPHCLIAGATGSGKSVCLNSFIISLLYQNSPETLRFILVDPKRVEMTIYNDIPHLLTPVIHEVDQIVNALRWTVAQMDYRYKLLSEARVRNLDQYNQKVVVGKLPYIVIVVDELADLMAVAARDVEAAIIRLAQMARAVGIHLILATQRPSVNVITGLIKANITTRLAFAVASQTDSRTIIDVSGAEKLLGRGDMLYISAETSKPRRLQGCLVSDEEIEKVTRYLKDRAEPDYDEVVVERQKMTIAGQPASSSFANDDDPLLVEAENVIQQYDKASASLLQRRLRIGYARAARLLDLLEERGIVGPGDGAKPREVLIHKDSWSSTTELPDEDADNPL